MSEDVFNRTTEIYRGVIVRNLSKEKAIEFLVYSLPNQVLMHITKKSSTFVSLVKNGKRIFNAEDQELLFNWYKEVSEFPLLKKDIAQNHTEIDREPLYNAEDVRDLENLVNLTNSDLEKTLLRFKQDAKKTLRSIKKNSKK